MKPTKDSLQKDYGEKATIFELKEFIEYVDVGAFTDSQGKSILIDAEGHENRTIVCSCNVKFLKKFKLKYKFVAWYGK